MATRVQCGQVYSLLNNFHIRYSVKIEKLDTVNEETLATCLVLDTRKPRRVSLRASVLANGKRGARLVSEPDGEVATPWIPKSPPPRQERERTASDYKRVSKPKGRAIVNEKMRAVYELRRDGVPSKEIAARFGMTRNAVFNWCSRVEEAIADARFLGETTGGRS